MLPKAGVCVMCIGLPLEAVSPIKNRPGVEQRVGPASEKDAAGVDLPRLLACPGTADGVLAAGRDGAACKRETFACIEEESVSDHVSTVPKP